MKAQKIILGYMRSPEKALDVAEKAREQGYRNLDMLMPYPVHGFEKALGLRKSWVPSIAKTWLVLGAGLAFLFQAWTSSVNWPINVGGKPNVSWPAFMPIVFEGAVLLAGLSTLAALLHFIRGFPLKKALIHHERLTDDRFALVIPYASDEDSASIQAFLKGCGLDEIEKKDS